MLPFADVQLSMLVVCLCPPTKHDIMSWPEEGCCNARPRFLSLT
jgi:hypothetical protein